MPCSCWVGLLQHNLAAAFRGWAAAVADSRELRAMLIHVIARFQHKTLAAAWSAWLAVTDYKHRGREAMQHAVILFQHQSMARAWRAWRDHAGYSVWRREKFQQVRITPMVMHCFRSAVCHFQEWVALHASQPTGYAAGQNTNLLLMRDADGHLPMSNKLRTF